MKIIITGITGQLAYYLTKLFLDEGHTVIGTMRRTSSPTNWRLQELPAPTSPRAKLIIREADITDYASIVSVIKEFNPDYFIHTAAMSYVHHSFKAPLATFEITGLGAMNCLDAIRQEVPYCKFLTCSSSEMFGNRAIADKERSEVKKTYKTILNERSGFAPRSPYGIAKLAAHHAVNNYRKSYSMWAAAPIMFNYESPYRGLEFVTRKITDSLARILTQQQSTMTLGNLDAHRDWSHCKDFAMAIRLMLLQDTPRDYVLASGKTYSIKDFLTLSFMCVSINDWEKYVIQDPALMRPSEVDVLIGDASKAHKELGWQPEYNFVDLVYSMVYADCLRHGNLNPLVPKEKVEEQWESYAKII